MILFVLSLFAGRLVQIQGFDASALAAEAQHKRLVKDTLTAHRGDIVDVNGQVLATTVDRVNVAVDQRIVGQYKQKRRVASPAGIDRAAQDLSQVLALPFATVRSSLTGSRRFAYVAKDIPPEDYRKVLALHVPGVYSQPASRRMYPAGEFGASLVGFLSKDGRPMAGIEKAENAVLKGADGSLTYERSQDSRQIPGGEDSAKEPVAGSTVRLTIDRDLQWKAQSLLDAQVAKTKAISGYVVVENPRTGAILAIASSPTFDANDPGRASSSDTGNRALTDIFEPGSTSKIMTASAAIQEGVATPRTQVLVPGAIRRGGTTIHDDVAHSTWKLTFTGVLAKSSNIGSIMVGEKVPPDRMYSYMRAFGLGERAGVGLPEQPGILATPDKWRGSQRYTVLFGQGLSVTALQVASVYSTIANGGVRVPPRLIDATISPDGTVRKEPLPAPVRVVSPRTASQVGLMLENVVGDDGTGRRAEIPGYRVAGKTGTAQYSDETCHCYRGYTASFVGYAPADDPALVVAVILQKPQEGHFGGLVSAPVFKEVMTYGLAKLGVPPTGKPAAPLALTWR